MRKIAIIHPRYQIGGGVDTVIYEVCRRLRDKYSFSIFTTNANFEQIRGIEVYNLYFAGFGYEKQIFLTMLFMFFNSNNYLNYDLIWTHSPPLILPALIIKKKLGVPILYTFHGIRTAPDPKLFFYKIIARSAFNKIDRIVGVSDYVTKEAKLFGANALRIYNGCDVEKFCPIFEDEGYMLTVSELASHKAVDIPIKVSHKLGIPLKVVGDGPERDRLERYARRIGSNVEFLGLLRGSELINLYQKCSFFISGSYYESFGLSLLEAEACGKPVVARNCAAIPEIVRHNETGLLCSGDHEYLLHSKALWENEALRKTFGRRAREFSENFQWSATANEYGKLIDSFFIEG